MDIFNNNEDIKPQDVIKSSTESELLLANVDDETVVATAKSLQEIQAQSESQRILYRSIMFWCFFGLLVIQYILLAAFIYYYIYSGGTVRDIQALLSIIIPATLGETYMIIKIMIEFVFKEGNYSIK